MVVSLPFSSNPLEKLKSHRRFSRRKATCLSGRDPFWNRLYAMNTKFVTRQNKKRNKKTPDTERFLSRKAFKTLVSKGTGFGQGKAPLPAITQQKGASSHR
jgi:hypothetical protein